MTVDDALFSCRNCVHNAGQSVIIGRGAGYCLKHETVLRTPATTTCKYLHRKDLPRFVVDEGLREHAGEFAAFSGVVELDTHKPVTRVPYSERYVWETHSFDAVTHTLAQYYKSNPAWVFVQAFAGGVDGRRALAHAGLVRRYMDHCGTWHSSYRMVLGMLQELDVTPQFAPDDVGGLECEAIWDVFFVKLGAVQEYGFHAGLESMMWATDVLNGGLSTLDWEALRQEVVRTKAEWTDAIIRHAVDNKVFFPPPDEAPHEEPRT